jgi:glycosyltransferase involved in cell wall biosynthesis
VVAHSDVFSWWWAVKGAEPPESWQEYYERVQAGLNGAGLVIAPSQVMLENIQNLYAPSSPIKVIYNWRAAEHFYIGEKLPEAMTMGRIWDDAKNIKCLLQAATQMDAGIRVAGENAFGQNQYNGNGANTRFLGKLDVHQVAKELATAAVFVLPAKYEPFGLSALEAAHSGCALVLGDIPSLREIWQDAALFVPTEDATALASTINQLLDDKQMQQQFAAKAKERAKAFTPGLLAPKYLHAYHQLVRQQELIKQETA